MIKVKRTDGLAKGHSRHIFRLLGPPLACSITVMLLTGCSTTDKSSWKVLQEDSYHNQFSYDMGSVERTSAKTIKVQVNSSRVRYWYEIDCRTKKMRILEDQGTAPTGWLDISSGSGDQLLYDEMCR